MHGLELLAWARAEYIKWHDTRHDPKRENADQLLARIYLRGAIDALKEETERLRHAQARP